MHRGEECHNHQRTPDDFIQALQGKLSLRAPSRDQPSRPAQDNDYDALFTPNYQDNSFNQLFSNSFQQNPNFSEIG